VLLSEYETPPDEQQACALETFIAEASSIAQLLETKKHAAR